MSVIRDIPSVVSLLQEDKDSTSVFMNAYTTSHPVQPTSHKFIPGTSWSKLLLNYVRQYSRECLKKISVMDVVVNVTCMKISRGHNGSCISETAGQRGYRQGQVLTAQDFTFGCNTGDVTYLESDWSMVTVHVFYSCKQPFSNMERLHLHSR